MFDGKASNQDVYHESAVEVVDQALQGYSGTVLAYGVTGSGKTHTIVVGIFIKSKI